MQPLYDNVGYEAKPEDGYYDVLARYLAISNMCAMGSQDCIDAAMNDFTVRAGSDT